MLRRPSCCRAMRYRRPANAGFASSVQHCAAWVAAASGDVDQAADTVMRAARDCRSRGDRQRELLLLESAARCGRQSETRHRLVELGRAVDGPVAPLLGAATAAAADADPASLTTSAAALRDHGWLLHAADWYAVAGHLFRAQGDALACSGALGNARRLYRRSGTFRTPAARHVDQSDPLAALSRREREVADAAARSAAPNAQLAQSLHLAKRTVDNHLARIYRKAGVSGRAELRDLVALLSDDPAPQPARGEA